MADAPDLGSGGRPCRFKSCYPQVFGMLSMWRKRAGSFVKSRFSVFFLCAAPCRGSMPLRRRMGRAASRRRWFFPTRLHMGVQRKYVIKPINRLADGRPAQRVVEKGIPLQKILSAYPQFTIHIMNRQYIVNVVIV